MLNEFRTSGAAFLDANDIVDVYFTAQHYGMPTHYSTGQQTPSPLYFSQLQTKKSTPRSGKYSL